MNIQKGKMVSGGRIQVPADVRKALELSDGDSLIMEVVDDELRIRSLNASIRRIQEMLKPYRPKEGEMLVSDELIADRRREAENE